MPRFLLLVLLGNTHALRVNVDDSKERPVTRVINLLKEMQDTLEKEADGDQKIYDAMACWCETNEKGKTKAIADGTQRDKELTARVPELAAKGAQLTVEIEQTTKEVAQNEEALNEATEIRAKELGEFREEEKNAVISIGGMKNAILALSSHHAMNQEAMLQVQQVLQRHASTQEAMRKLGLEPAQKRTVEAMLQQHKGKSPHEAHAPASGEIFGILKSMKETFETNLAGSQKDEQESVSTFESLSASKNKEISSGKTQLSNKKEELANTEEKREESKEDLADTREQVTADQAFLLDLQERCGSMDKQFADRQKMRGEETKAVGEALKILTDDDAHDLFSKSTGFIQESMVKSQRVASARDRAVKLLQDAAAQSASPELAMLATALRSDVFAKIQDSIDKMVAQLEVEQNDDVEQRNVCIDTLNTNEKDTAVKYSEKSDLETKLEDLGLLIEKLSDEIAVAKAEIADTQAQMKTASENRELENHDFQVTIQDQRATQELLAKALKKLEAFYKAALLQLSSTKQAPPAEFGEYKKAGGAGGVMGMMENIIDESKQVETEAMAAETDAQNTYEQFMKDSHTSIDALVKANNDRTATKAQAEADNIRAAADLKSTNQDIEALETFRDQTHQNCDFLLKNFEVRQSARTQEKEALAQAKAVMSGADA